MNVRQIVKRVRGSVKRAAKVLFPPDLMAYIPGQKLIAAGVVYVAAAVAGLEEDQVFHLPDPIGEVTVGIVASAVAAYLWPTNKAPKLKFGRKARRQS